MNHSSDTKNISEIEILRSEIRHLEELLLNKQSQLDEAHLKYDELSVLLAKKNNLIDKLALSGCRSSDSADLSSTSGISDISSFVTENIGLRDQVKHFKSVISELNLKIDELSLEVTQLKDSVAEQSVEDNSLLGSESSDDLLSQITSLSAERSLVTKQLHQVQEELQYYFLLSRSQSELLKKHEKVEHLAISHLLDRLNS